MYLILNQIEHSLTKINYNISLVISNIKIKGKRLKNFVLFFIEKFIDSIKSH